MAELVVFLRSCGPTLSPFNAWVFLKSLETLALRMRAHSAAALKLAQWLQEQPAVEKVFYAGLPEHPGALLVHTDATHSPTRRSNVSSGTAPGVRTASWKPLMSKRSPS